MLSSLILMTCLSQLGAEKPAAAPVPALPKPHYRQLPTDPPWLVQAVQFHGHLGPWVVTGTRLGMGGGFYDRSFAFLRDPDKSGQRPRLVGLAYEFQQVEALVRQPWDVPLDAAATEKTWSVFG